MGADLSAERLCDYRCFGSIDTLNNHFAGSGLRPKYLIADCDTYLKFPGDERTITADLVWTFPLEYLEVVWGDGQATRRQIIDLHDSGEFGSGSHDWKVRAPGWTWARVAVWDVAANGAFVNPVRR